MTMTDEAGDPKSSSRIPSLDGMRAIAVSFVCVAHLIGGPAAASDLGTIGVRVFFVLSGFLITTLLLREYDRHGTINLPRFYFRRALRIFPAYYTYLAVIARVFYGVIEQIVEGFLQPCAINANRR